MTRSLRGTSRACAALLLAACGGGEGASPEPPRRALEVEFAGCAEVRRGPVCELDEDRELVLWTPLPERTAVLVTIDGAPAPVSQARVEGGAQLRVEVPRGARAVVVEAEDAAFRLAVGEAHPLEALQPAIAAREAGDFEEAERRLAGPLASEDAYVRARAASLGARIAFARGDTDAALSGLVVSSESFESLGGLMGAASDRTVLAMLLTLERWRFEDSQRELERAEVLAGAIPETQAHLLFTTARVLTHLGDYLGALDLFRTVRESAARLGLDDLTNHVRQQESLVLQGLGRHDEALAALTTRVPSEPGCARADHLTSLGWIQLQASEGRARQRAVSYDPRPRFEEALREYGASCPRAYRVGNAHLNLALAALQADDPQAARASLEAARAHFPSESATLRAWELEAEARVALAAGATDDALATWAELLARAELAGDTSFEWRARYGAARAHRAAGDAGDAIAALREAEARVDHAMLRLGVGDGRAELAGEHEPSARALVSFLVDEGRAAEALAVARRARRRALRASHRAERLRAADPAQRARWTRSVEAYWAARARVDEAAEDAWRLPASELAARSAQREDERAALATQLRSALALLDGAADEALDGADDEAPSAPGEVTLTFFPVDLPSGAGWVGFAATADDLEARRIAPLAEDAARPALATALLEPFAGVIAAAERVRIVSYGELDAVDFHALPFEGAPLADRRAVVYGLDLGGPATPSAASRSALVVADPRLDLPAAGREGAAVVARLEAAELAVETLRGDDARPDRFARALQDVDLLHYAGHGRFDGRDGWGSHLPLAGASELSVGDVLMLPSAPREVVLSACEGGRAQDARSGVAGWSLARAFVIAGSGSVLAAIRPVGDEAAAQLAAAYYARRLDEDRAPADALRLAVRALRDAHPDVDWTSYRVFVP